MLVSARKPKWTDRILLLDLFAGLKTTFKEFFRPKFTVEYPEKKLEPSDRFRGMFRFSYDRCIACKICAMACPIDIIYIDVSEEIRQEGEKKKKVKVLDRYDIDVKRCMFCALCEEACPTKPKSIWLTTKTYELASYDREELYFNMQELEYWDGRPEYLTLEELAAKKEIGSSKALPSGGDE